MKLIDLLKASAMGIILCKSMYASAIEVKKEITLDLNSSNKLIYIRNLAGEVEISPSSDNQIHIRGLITANVDNSSTGEKLLNTITFSTKNTRNQTIVSVNYPVDTYDGFIYKPVEVSTAPVIYNQAFDYMGEKVNLANIYKKSNGNWAEVHTDLIIELPANQWNKLNIIAGDISSRNLNSESTLIVDKGKIKINDSKGKLNLKTNQGLININNHFGQVKASTGYGDIEITNPNGVLLATSRTGNIIISEAKGDIETNTEIGTVSINKFLEGDTVTINSERGDVRVNGNLENLKDLDIETNKGNVKIISTHVPSLNLKVNTGGDIKIDLPELKIKNSTDNIFLAKVGKNKGKASIESQNGAVSFTMPSDLESEIARYAIEDKVEREHKSKKTRDSRLAAMVRIALSRHKHILDKELKIIASDGKIIAKGDLDNPSDIAKAMGIILSVDGVKEASVKGNNKASL